MKYVRRTTESYIKECSIVHNHKYDYSKTRFNGMLKKITVICKVHGEFQPYAQNHLKGTGCKKCSQYDTLEEFINKAINVHGEKYSYSKSVYTGSKNNIDIECPMHGFFHQRPNDHLNGSGCPTCKPNHKITTEEFIDRANRKHNHEYDYSLVEYIKSNKPVIIQCSLHGKFSQTPNNHLCGCGCPKCSNYGFSPDIDGYFYLQEIKTGDLVYYKFGITNRPVETRLLEQKKKSNLEHEIVYVLKSSGTIVQNLEKILKRKYNNYVPKLDYPDGYTETFSIDDLQSVHDIIVEYILDNL